MLSLEMPNELTPVASKLAWKERSARGAEGGWAQGSAPRSGVYAARCGKTI